MKASVLQILPRAPGTMGGVGDYARELARGLRDQHGIDSVFVARETSAVAPSGRQNVTAASGLPPRTDGSDSVAPGISPAFDSRDEIDSFRIFTLREFVRAPRVSNEACDGIILHYVNYGFQKRGVPVTLVELLKELRRDCGGALLVIFHELFASGPPWRSEFWLRGLQKKIARELAQLADVRLVSCESMRRQLERLSRESSAIVQPVTSTWGEPALDEAQIRARDPHCWLICGGTALLERSLRSFLKIANGIPSEITPRKVFVIGGSSNPHVRALLNAPVAFTSEYIPAIAPASAAPLFGQAAFAWLDYFSSPNVPADVLLKSSTFVGLCAHGIVSVLPEVSGEIAIDDDKLPVPFSATKLPSSIERADAAVAAHRWYHRHASAAHLTRVVAQQLRLA